MGWMKDVLAAQRGVRNMTYEQNTAWMREPQTQEDRTRIHRELEDAKAYRREALLGRGRTRQAELQAQGRGPGPATPPDAVHDDGEPRPVRSADMLHPADDTAEAAERDRQEAALADEPARGEHRGAVPSGGGVTQQTARDQLWHLHQRLNGDGPAYVDDPPERDKDATGAVTLHGPYASPEQTEAAMRSALADQGVTVAFAHAPASDGSTYVAVARAREALTQLTDGQHDQSVVQRASTDPYGAYSGSRPDAR